MGRDARYILDSLSSISIYVNIYVFVAVYMKNIGRYIN